jgi:S1-C subfamily serine protease
LPRDVVVAVDGREVTTMSDLAAAIRRHRPGDTVTVEIVRAAERQTVRLTLVERPAAT